MEGLCRLHLCDEELCNSHIIPRWTYRRLLQQPGANGVVRVQDDTAINDTRQETEYLLCEHAEQRFSRWEQEVAAISLQTDDRFPALDRVQPIPDLLPQGDLALMDGSALPDELGLFALSVLWRASVSVRYPQVALGPYGEEFRAYLADEVENTPGCRLHVDLIRLPGAEYPRVDRHVIHPESHRHEGDYHLHQFVIFGMHFRIYVGRCIPPAADELCFLRTKRVSVSNGRAVLAAVAERAQLATPRGRLARDE